MDLQFDSPFGQAEQEGASIASSSASKPANQTASKKGASVLDGLIKASATAKADAAANEAANFGGQQIQAGKLSEVSSSEKSVLAAVLQNPRGPNIGWYEVAAKGLASDSFSSVIGSALAMELNSNNTSHEDANSLLVTLTATRQEDWRAVIDELSAMPTGNIDEAIKAIIGSKVNRLAIQRMNAYKQMVETGEATQADLSKLISDLATVASNKPTKHIHSYGETIQAGFDYMRELANPETKGRVIYTGVSALYDMLGGAQPGDLLVVAGRPSTGKTACIVNFADAATWSDHIRCKRFGGEDENKPLPIGIVSGEQPVRQIGLRSLMVANQMDTSAIRSGAPPINQLEKAYKMTNDTVAAEKAGDKYVPPIFLFDAHQPTVEEVFTTATAWKAQHDIRVLFVDYLQLLKTEEKYRPSERQAQVGYITNLLKQLAIELQIPVIAMAQLSKDADRRPGGIPTANDVADSDIVFKTADSIVAIHQPSLYDQDASKETINFFCLKNKHGPTGSVAAHWSPSTITVSDLVRQPWSIRAINSSESSFDDGTNVDELLDDSWPTPDNKES